MGNKTREAVCQGLYQRIYFRFPQFMVDSFSVDEVGDGTAVIGMDMAETNATRLGYDRFRMAGALEVRERTSFGRWVPSFFCQISYAKNYKAGRVIRQDKKMPWKAAG